MNAEVSMQTDPIAERGDGTHKLISVAVIVVFLGLPGLLLLQLGVGASLFLLNSFGENAAPAQIDPHSGFAQLTGWQLPGDATVLKNVNTHGGFKNDGDYTLVIRMNPEQLQDLIDHAPHTWTDCPIARDIVNGARRLPKHTGTSYWAKKTDDFDADWHRGHVVIVNRESGMVWIHEWKH